MRPHTSIYHQKIHREKDAISRSLSVRGEIIQFRLTILLRGLLRIIIIRIIDTLILPLSWGWWVIEGMSGRWFLFWSMLERYFRRRRCSREGMFVMWKLITILNLRRISTWIWQCMVTILAKLRCRVTKMLWYLRMIRRWNGRGRRKMWVSEWV